VIFADILLAGNNISDVDATADASSLIVMGAAGAANVSAPSAVSATSSSGRAMPAPSGVIPYNSSTAGVPASSQTEGVPVADPLLSPPTPPSSTPSPSTPPRTTQVSHPLPAMTPLRLGPNLREYILNLSPTKQRTEISRLGKISDHERTREDNILANKKLLAALGIPDIVIFDKRPKGKDGGNGTKGAVLDDDAFDPDREDSDEDASNSPSPRPIYPRRSTRHNGVAPLQSANPTTTIHESAELDIAGPSITPSLSETAPQVSSDNASPVNSPGPGEALAPDTTVETADALSNTAPRVSSDNVSPFNNSLGPGETPLPITTVETVGATFAFVLNKSEWPNWIMDWYKIFVARGFVAAWEELVLAWTCVEREHKFVSPVSQLSYL
jgi:hypothetical protein